jgi:hypothetical protein
MKLAKWIFLIAGIFGLLATIPLAFSGKVIEQMMPGSLSHPEFFYGFVLLDMCWQVLYLFLSTDPVRYRPMMIPSLLAKASGTVALTWLYVLGRVSGLWITVAIVDGVFAVLFLIAFWATGRGMNKTVA